MSSVSWQTLITTRTNFVTRLRLRTRPQSRALWKLILFVRASPAVTWQIRWVALSTWQKNSKSHDFKSLISNTSKIMASSRTYYISCRDYKLLICSIKRPKNPRPLNTSIWSPLNLLVSSVVSPHSFSRSSYLRSLNPGMSLVALLWIFSSISMSFLRYGLHACIQYSKWGFGCDRSII